MQGFLAIKSLTLKKKPPNNMQLSGGLTPQTKLRAELSGEFLR